MQTIFISYRRVDGAETAGRIFDRLTQHFGRERVFKDVHSIPLDTLYGPYLLEQVKSSVVLALIGPQWATCTGADGARRLDAESDLVRREIETAIECGVPLIPIPVLKASLPRRDDLPPSLRSLIDREAHPVRPDPDFHSDMDRLIARLEPLTGKADGVIAVPRDLIERVLADCQAWHTEIVTAMARIDLDLGAADPSDTSAVPRARATNFVYQNTRNHMPRLLSARATLVDIKGAEGLTSALEGFLMVVAQPGTRDDMACLPLMPAGPSLLSKYMPNPDQTYLPRLNAALQCVSDEVTALTARQR